MLNSCSEEQMAVNKIEWEQIARQIREALNEHSRTPLNRFKSWSPFGGIIAIALFLLLQWNGYTIFKTHTEDHLSGIESELVSLRALTASNQPLRRQNQDAAKELLAQAKKKLIPPIPEATVQQAGGNFIEASSQDQGAWKVALDFISYRSWLNVSQFPATAQALYQPAKDTDMAYYFVPSVPGRNEPKVMVSNAPPAVPMAEGARFELINHPAKQTSLYGNRSLLVYGGAVTINGMYLRHVVLTGVEVHYAGGPVILDDVLFVDCSFVMDDVEAARSMAAAILASPKVTVTI